jgi:type II secretory pathway component PulF
MNLDEFAFFNQQLAAMLRDGIPLEGALQRLSADMRHGALRAELQTLTTDLAQGTPLAEALPKRRLPDLYCRLLTLGARGEDLPGTLTLVADYYQRQHALWTRLKGLLVYPVLLVFACFLLSVLLWQITSRYIMPTWWESIQGLGEGRPLPAITNLALPLLQHSWVFPLIFVPPLILIALLWWSPRLRRQVLDRLPAFREARLAQTAGAAELLLKTGLPLPDALALLADFQPPGRLRRELAAWRANIAAGVKRVTAFAAGSRYVPPLFIWIVDSAGEDVRLGFRRAAELYEERAQSRIQIMLYAVLPVSVLTVGSIVVGQAFLITSMYVVFIDLFNNLGG